MKALTVWQPWASLIVVGAKPYEFRGHRPPRAMIGQRIVIHAAARPLNVNDVIRLIRFLEHEDRRMGAATCLHRDVALPLLKGWLDRPPPAGAGLGTAMLGEPRLGTEVAQEFGFPRVNDSERDEHANWAWPMLDIAPFDPIIPMRGAQGLWTWPEPEGVLA